PPLPPPSPPVPPPAAPPIPPAKREVNDYFAALLPLPGQNLPDPVKSGRAHSSLMQPSDQDEKKKSDPFEKKPSVWTQATPARRNTVAGVVNNCRNEFEKPENCDAKPEPSSNNAKDEEERTENKAKRRKREKEQRTDGMDELRRKAEKQVLQ
ncbi:hypothetical protein PFISCL1PPCAC_3580, partial [Pristionchus fissidentatus]